MKAKSIRNMPDSDLFVPRKSTSLDSSPEIAAALNGSGLVDLFERFYALESQVKLVNEGKAVIFDLAKKSGFDPKAVRAAFRQRLRELEKPEIGAKHDAQSSLTASYLEALRGDHASAGQNGSSHPADSCEASQACSEPLARSRTREGASDAVVPSDVASKLRSLSGAVAAPSLNSRPS
jgi:uncharacterized protein (UPF0335 family)